MQHVNSSSHLMRTIPLPGFEVKKCLGRLSQNLLDVKNGQPLVASRVSNTPGRHERKACDLAMSAACDVLSNHSCKSSQQAAMSKTLGILVGGGPDRFGNIVINQLVALGALRMGIVDRIASAGGGADLNSRLERVDGAIIEIGVAAGRVKGIADGCRGSDKQSQALDKLLGKAEKTVADCIGKGEDAAKLMASIASAILPGPILDAVRERLPALAAKIDAGELELDIGHVIHAGLRDKTEEVIRHKLSMGDGENIASAIFDLLKLPQYVVSNELGSAKPASPSSGTDPHTIDPALRELCDMSADTHGSILYNYTPVKVKNDFSSLKDILSQSGGQSVPVEFVRNLLAREDQRRDVAFKHGLDIGQMEEHIRHLQDQLRQQAAGGADVHSRLASQNERYLHWAVGPENLFKNADSPSVRIETVVAGMGDSIQQTQSTLESSASDNESGFGDAVASVNGDYAQSGSVARGGQDGLGDRITDAGRDRLQSVFPIDQRHADGGLPSTPSDQRLNSSPVSVRMVGSMLDSADEAGFGRVHTGGEGADATGQQTADASPSSAPVQVSRGAWGNAVDHRQQQNIGHSSDRPNLSNEDQPELDQLVASGTVRNLIAKFNSLSSAPIQDFDGRKGRSQAGANYASGAVVTGRSEPVAASVALGSRPPSVAGGGRAQKNAMSEGVATTAALLAFQSRPRARLTSARGAAEESNAARGAVPGSWSVQDRHEEAERQVDARGAGPVLLSATDRNARTPSTALNYVAAEDEMPVFFSGSKHVTPDDGVDLASATSAVGKRAEDTSLLLPAKQVSPENKLFGAVPSERSGSVLKELKALVEFRLGDTGHVTPIKPRDKFRAVWEAAGGRRFSPPMPPVPRSKETFLLREHELERVNVQLAENRAQKNTPLLHDVFREKSDHGPQMQAVMQMVDHAAPSSASAASADGDELAVASFVGAGSDGNWTLRAAEPHVVAAKKLFNSPAEQLLQKYVGPFVSGFRAAS